MAQNSPSVGVVVPLYNSESSILRALHSVINQTIAINHLAIVDDRSTDSSVELVIEFIDKYLVNCPINYTFVSLLCNSGPSVARNIGLLSLDECEYIAFLDADDFWLTHKLESCLDVIEDSLLVGHMYEVRFGTGNKEALSDGLSQRKIYNKRSVSLYSLLIRNFLQTSSVLVRNGRDMFFDEKMRFCEDYDLWLRILGNGRGVYLEHPLTILGRPQLSPGGLSGDNTQMRIGELKALYSMVRRVYWLRPFFPFFILWSLIKSIRTLVLKIF